MVGEFDMAGGHLNIPFLYWILQILLSEGAKAVSVKTNPLEHDRYAGLGTYSDIRWHEGEVPVGQMHIETNTATYVIKNLGA